MIFPRSPLNNMVCRTSIGRFFFLALFFASFAALTASLHAQQQSSSQTQSLSSQTQSSSKSQSSRQQQPRSHEPGFGHQLTHETREAAGEEKNETEEFKQSPAVQFIARITGLSVPHAYMFSVFLNFGVVAIVIIWAAAKFLPRVFKARTEAIQKAMREAQKASEEARRKLSEIESRLQKLDVEIGMIRDAAEKDAAAEQERIRAAAEEEKRKIVDSAQHEIAAAAKAARRELTAYAADLAVALAKKQIRVDAATDQALVRNFAGELGAYSAIGSATRPGAAGKDEH
jgi:F-type H+-transporting ATPase subunit b